MIAEVTPLPPALTLKACVSCVGRFHELIRAPIAELPRTLPVCPDEATAVAAQLMSLRDQIAATCDPSETLLMRAAMAIEELAEWIVAHARLDLVEAADALGDRLYVLIGDAVTTGLPLAGIFQAVHASNLTKQEACHGAWGKGVKGANYHRPRLQQLLATAHASAAT